MNDEASNSDPLAEIDAMKSVAEALSPLDGASCGRVLRWAADRFGVTVSEPKASTAEIPPESGDLTDPDKGSFDSVADLYSAANPGTEPEKALVLAYWFQEIVGDSEFESAKLNRELKHMGHGLSNVTKALNSLIGKKPSLAIQTKKSGSSKQARKKYKLTHAGVQKVQEMLQGA